MAKKKVVKKKVLKKKPGRKPVVAAATADSAFETVDESSVSAAQGIQKSKWDDLAAAVNALKAGKMIILRPDKGEDLDTFKKRIVSSTSGTTFMRRIKERNGHYITRRGVDTNGDGNPDAVGIGWKKRD